MDEIHAGCWDVTQYTPIGRLARSLYTTAATKSTTAPTSSRHFAGQPDHLIPAPGNNMGESFSPKRRKQYWCWNAKQHTTYNIWQAGPLFSIHNNGTSTSTTAPTSNRHIAGQPNHLIPAPGNFNPGGYHNNKAGWTPFICQLIPTLGAGMRINIHHLTGWPGFDTTKSLQHRQQLLWSISGWPA